MMLAAALLLTPPPTDCRNPGTFYEPDACASNAAWTAEGEMASALADARRTLREAGRENGNSGDEAKLTAAQRAWTDYRDAHCYFAGRDAIEESVRQTLVNRCYVEQTRRRTEELRRLALR